ncbi:MAG: hypothetical protein HYU25_06345 [Candidatus Rokubacteria bacterium]|nr:hypothetical protein [Candidatus Rokubacteria bacterium]
MTRAASAATLTRVNLAELLTVTALVGLTLSGTLAALQQGLQAYLTREIRGAGAGGAAFDAIAVAERERIVLQFDLDRDGAITRRGETVTWRLADTVLRRDAGGGAQPVVNGVRRLVLQYLDARDQPARAPGEVRTVAITLVTEGEGGTGLTTLTTRVRSRNR